MTYEEFSKELEKLNLKWIATGKPFNSSYFIRCESGNCPILAVALDKGFQRYRDDDENEHWVEAAEFIGLDEQIAYNIVREADHFRYYERPSWAKNLNLDVPGIDQI